MSLHSYIITMSLPLSLSLSLSLSIFFSLPLVEVHHLHGCHWCGGCDSCYNIDHSASCRLYGPKMFVMKTLNYNNYIKAK